MPTPTDHGPTCGGPLAPLVWLDQQARALTAHIGRASAPEDAPGPGPFARPVPAAEAAAPRAAGPPNRLAQGREPAGAPAQDWLFLLDVPAPVISAVEGDCVGVARLRVHIRRVPGSPPPS